MTKVTQNLLANVGDARQWVGSLGWEDLLEKKITPHSSILAWKISWAEEPGGQTV